MRTISLLFVAMAACLWGQNTVAEIVGTVTAQDQAALAGATVTVQNEATGLERKLTTNAQGSYAAPSLPVGQYKVTVAMDGFRPKRARASCFLWRA